MDDDSGGVQPPRTLFSLGRPGSKKENGDGAVLADEVVSCCPACGAALVPGAAFCGECGAALTAAAPEADAATVAGADAAAAEVDDEGVEYEYEYVEEYEYEEVPEDGAAGVAGGGAGGVVGGAVAARPRSGGGWGG